MRGSTESVSAKSRSRIRAARSRCTSWVSTGLPECSPAIAACAHSRVLTLPSKVDARMRRPTSESLAAVLARSSRFRRHSPRGTVAEEAGATRLNRRVLPLLE